jgi:hypothetical protein
MLKRLDITKILSPKDEQCQVKSFSNRCYTPLLISVSRLRFPRAVGEPPGKAEVARFAREENREIPKRRFLPLGDFIFFIAS